MTTPMTTAAVPSHYKVVQQVHPELQSQTWNMYTVPTIKLVLLRYKVAPLQNIGKDLFTMKTLKILKNDFFLI